MHDIRTYDYAIVRVVPRVERGEFLNVGVILSCDVERITAACIDLDESALRALDASVDLELVRKSLDSILRIAAGGAAAGSLGRMSPRERFHWLTAPKSALIQTSPVHTGQCTDLAAAAAHLMDRMVRRPRGLTDQASKQTDC